MADEYVVRIVLDGIDNASDDVDRVEGKVGGLTQTNGSGAAGTTHVECFAYHQDAVAHAIGADVSSNMQYHNDKDSYFILNKMQQNTVLIDAEGVFELELKK